MAKHDARLISMATYNLHGLHDPEGVARTLAALDFVDVWAFQEVNKSIAGQADKIAFNACDPPARLLRLFSAPGWNVFYVPMNRTKRGKEWEGMAIVSRRPMLEQGVWPLRATGPKRRGALYCVIAADAGNRALIVNTDHEVEIFSITPRDRQQQVEDLNARLRSPDYSGLPAALLGDFNTTGFPLMPWRMNAREEVSALKQSLAAAGMRPLPQSAPPYNTFMKFPVRRPLDHIFMRDFHCMKWGVTNGYVGSDHRPVWMTARINTPAGPGSGSGGRRSAGERPPACGGPGDAGW